MISILIDFYGTIDGPDKYEATNDADGSTKEGKAHGDHTHVRDVDNYWQYANQIQSTHEEPQAVQE